MLSGWVSRWTGQRTDPERVAHRLEDIRLAMLDMLGDEGARQNPQVARRIRFGGDAQALWYANGQWPGLNLSQAIRGWLQ